MSDSVRPHRQQPTRLPRPWESPGKNTGVGCHFLLQCMKVKSESEVSQSCPTLSDPMDCSLPGSSVHEISQARVLEWGAIAFSAVPGYNGALLPILSATELQPAMDPLKPLTTCSRNHPNCIIFPLSEIQKSQSTSTLAGRSQKRANF